MAALAVDRLYFGLPSHRWAFAFFCLRLSQGHILSQAMGRKDNMGEEQVVDSRNEVWVDDLDPRGVYALDVVLGAGLGLQHDGAHAFAQRGSKLQVEDFVLPAVMDSAATQHMVSARDASVLGEVAMLVWFVECGGVLGVLSRGSVRSSRMVEPGVESFPPAQGMAMAASAFDRKEGLGEWVVLVVPQRSNAYHEVVLFDGSGPLVAAYHPFHSEVGR